MTKSRFEYVRQCEALWRCSLAGRKKRENPWMDDAFKGIKEFCCTLMKSPTEGTSKTCERHSTETYLISSVIVNTFLPHCHRHVSLHTDIRASASWALIKNSCKSEWSIWPNFQSDVNIFSAMMKSRVESLRVVFCTKCENCSRKYYLLTYDGVRFLHSGKSPREKLWKRKHFWENQFSKV